MVKRVIEWLMKWSRLDEEYVLMRKHTSYWRKRGRNQFQGQPERDGIGSTPWDF